MLLTVIPAVAAGVLSFGPAHTAAWLGYGEYESNLVVLLGILLVLWIGAALAVETTMLVILAATLSMLGSYLVTRDITTASYGGCSGSCCCSSCSSY